MNQKATPLLNQPFSYKETRGTIITDSKRAIDAAKLAIKANRKQLEKFIQQNPIFLYSLEPVQINRGPEVVKRMAEASEEAGVGPMAAVAGVLADLAVEHVHHADRRCSICWA
jgi:ApbE superfamily uncharacterized protein (UPF0280 family)